MKSKFCQEGQQKDAVSQYIGENGFGSSLHEDDEQTFITKNKEKLFKEVQGQLKKMDWFRE